MRRLDHDCVNRHDHVTCDATLRPGLQNKYSPRHIIQMFPVVCAQSLHEPCFEASVAMALWVTVQLLDLD